MTDVAHTAEKAALALDDRLRLTGDHLLVQPLAIPEKVGTLFIPETSNTRERPQRGIVKATGPGAWTEAGTSRRPMTIEIGDLVFFGKYAGQDETIAGLPLLLMSEDEVVLHVHADGYAVTEHEDARFNHLTGDSCPICDKPAEDAAAAALALERERLRAEKGPVERMTDEGSIGTGPYHSAASEQQLQDLRDSMREV